MNLLLFSDRSHPVEGQDLEPSSGVRWEPPIGLPKPSSDPPADGLHVWQDVFCLNPKITDLETNETNLVGSYLFQHIFTAHFHELSVKKVEQLI